MPLRSFSVGHPLLAMLPTLQSTLFPQIFSDKTKFSFAIGYQLEIPSQLEMGLCVSTSPLRSWILSGIASSSACCHSLCEFICALIVLIYKALLTCPPSPLALTLLPPPEFPELCGEGDLIETLHLQQVFQALSLCILSGSGSLYLFPSVPRRSFSDDG